ncbi:MAG: Organic solvent tolerance protein [Pedosphaera sp.]|nr:Organic solvent tolerance protein [Pedosphaera sp.]
MTKLHVPFSFFLLWLSLVCVQAVPQPKSIVIEAPEEVEFDPATGIGIATNGVVVKTDEAVLTADRASINQFTGDIFAEGSVRMQQNDQTWTGQRLHYNFQTRELNGDEFRTGKSPLFAAGQGLHGGVTNNIYTATATNTFVTADDYFRPLLKVRAKYLKIVPGQYFEARNATLLAGKVPLFFFPYYRRSLEENASHFTVLPGYRSTYGPFLLSSYTWFLNDQLDGVFHADWREKRGFGAGPDFGFHLGDYGEGILKYYYTHDRDPGIDQSTVPIPENRQRLSFGYQATPLTNLTLKSQIAYWSDPLVTHDFFENEYRKDIQPKTFFEANQLWQNWSLDALAQPRVNNFFETVERLPDVRLSGFRQQIADTPLYYESESSAGWYRRLFSDTNLLQGSFSAARADTFHQITLPKTFFGWLTATPRVGGRFTYYSTAEGPGATTTEQYRKVFNTGMEVSTKASRVWSGVQNHLFDVDGLRHIIEPSINYVYVPSPSVLPSQLPQFDYLQPTNLYLVPIEFPDFNAIDSIDSQNVIRYGLRNRLQTKRNGQIENLVNWSIYTDWRLKPLSGQTTFSDIFSDLELKPRNWLTFRSQLRYDVNQGVLNLAQSQLTFQPNNTWSWGIGNYYLRTGPLFGTGNNLFTSTLYYRFNDNWGVRMSHHFDERTGVMQEQYYTLYRDLRSWTAALTFRARDNQGALGNDYTVAVSFSLKAFPRFGLGQDTVTPSTLVGF